MATWVPKTLLQDQFHKTVHIIQSALLESQSDFLTSSFFKQHHDIYGIVGGTTGGPWDYCQLCVQGSLLVIFGPLWYRGLKMGFLQANMISVP